MKRFLFILSVAIALFGVSVIASALDYNADLSLSLAERYSDNILLTHTDKTSGFSTDITPAVAISTKTEKGSAILTYAPSFLYYNSHSELDSISHQASVNGDYQVSKAVTLTVLDNFLLSKDSTVLRSLDTAGPITRSQETITTNTFVGTLAYKLTDKVSLQPSVSYIVTDNSQIDVSDIHTYMGSLTASYLLTYRTALRAVASYTHYDYSIGRDVNGQDYNVGLNHKFTPTITADIYIGYNITKTVEQGNSETGLNGGISVAKKFEKGTASIAYTQGVIPSLQDSAPIKSKLLLLRYDAPIATRLDAVLLASYGIYEDIDNTGVDRKRTEVVGTAGLSYKVLPWANLTLTYSYVNSRDNLERTDSYYSNVIMAGITLSKQAKF